MSYHNWTKIEVEKVKEMLSTYSRYEIAEKLDVTINQINHLLHGRGLIKFERLKKVQENPSIFIDGFFNTSVPAGFNYCTGMTEMGCSIKRQKYMKEASFRKINNDNQLQIN